jgi:hypothetical protein
MKQLQVTIRESMDIEGTRLGGFLLSLPERVVRSAAALAAGLAREIGNIVLPRTVRNTLLYRLMVENSLRFLIQEVGEVDGVYESNRPMIERFAFRRAASHGIEAAGIFAFHASPVWVLAILADLSGAGQSLINQISNSLREEGLLSGDQRPFESVDQLLDGLEKSAGHLAQAVNMPPLKCARSGANCALHCLLRRFCRLSRRCREIGLSWCGQRSRKRCPCSGYPPYWLFPERGNCPQTCGGCRARLAWQAGGQPRFWWRASSTATRIPSRRFVASAI